MLETEHASRRPAPEVEEHLAHVLARLQQAEEAARDALAVLPEEPLGRLDNVREDLTAVQFQAALLESLLNAEVHPDVWDRVAEILADVPAIVE